VERELNIQKHQTYLPKKQSTVGATLFIVKQVPTAKEVGKHKNFFSNEKPTE
jgi:hypothetical protein